MKSNTSSMIKGNARLTQKSKEKMPTQVFYNLNTMLSPASDPKNNIVLGVQDKNRVSRLRTKMSPSPSANSASSKCVRPH